MNHDALRAANVRLVLAQDATLRKDWEGASRHLLGLQAALAEMHESRNRRRTDRTVARVERVEASAWPREAFQPAPIAWPDATPGTQRPIAHGTDAGKPVAAP